jgi:hypothetical protein
LTVKSWTEVADDAAAMVESAARIDGAAAEIERVRDSGGGATGSWELGGGSVEMTTR